MCGRDIVHHGGRGVKPFLGGAPGAPRAHGGENCLVQIATNGEWASARGATHWRAIWEFPYRVVSAGAGEGLYEGTSGGPAVPAVVAHCLAGAVQAATVRASGGPEPVEGLQ